MQTTKMPESPCIRCGKTRIIGKVWTEKNEKGSPITHTETLCPDAECQKIVDADFAAKRERKLEMTNRNKKPVVATAAS